MKLFVNEIANLVGGEVVGDKNLFIDGVAGLEDATQMDLTFLANPKYYPYLEKTKANVIIVDKKFDKKTDKTLIKVQNPTIAFSQILNIFESERKKKFLPKNISPKAIIKKTAKIGRNVSIGAYSIVEEDSEIGDDTIIFPLCYIGKNTKIGKNCLIYPNVVIREEVTIGNNVIIHSGSVIGADGFGYVKGGGNTGGAKHIKIPQIGKVEIQDDVEIGASVTVDRATTGKTVIGRGTKIDNLVMIAHNVVIGENCIIVAQSGVAGSSKVGDNTILAAQSGVVNHLKVGKNVVATARTGITKNIPDGSIVSGFPVANHKEWLKAQALILKLPKIYQDLEELKKCIKKQ